MSTHAERIREAERKVIEAAKLHATRWRRGRCLTLDDHTRELMTLESQACPKCGGDGAIGNPRYVYGGPDEPLSITCPAGCDNGRKREE